MNEQMLVPQWQWVSDNWVVLLPAALVILDAVAGYLPDKFLPYVGIVRRVISKIGGK